MIWLFKTSKYSRISIKISDTIKSEDNKEAQRQLTYLKTRQTFYRKYIYDDQKIDNNFEKLPVSYEKEMANPTPP
jgi:hypothetical protein